MPDPQDTAAPDVTPAGVTPADVTPVGVDDSDGSVVDALAVEVNAAAADIPDNDVGADDVGDTVDVGVAPDACVPSTCVALGRACGDWPDGYGGVASCGACGAGASCDDAGQCAILPLSCAGVSCPVWPAYAAHCNAADHCEYAPVVLDAPWRAYDVWIWVPPGAFPMGGPEDEVDAQPRERPVHTVTFADGFFVASFELTVAIHEACEAAGACATPTVADYDAEGFGLSRSANGRARHPQNGLSWHEARDACAWVTPGGRLPSEAEWERAATGTTHRRFPWGESEATCAEAVLDAGEGWGCGDRGTAEVGSRPAGASAVGAMDMGGNLREWVEDCFHPHYQGAPDDGSVWVGGCVDPGVPGLRGGAFNYPAAYLRVAERYGCPESLHIAYNGARCARSALPPPGP